MLNRTLIPLPARSYFLFGPRDSGSSARKLKQAGVNLLAGRASIYRLFPFTSQEIGKSFQLQRALEYGLLPEAYL